MKIQDLFTDDSQYVVVMEQIHDSLSKLHHVKSYNLIIEMKDVDDKFKYVYTDLSLKVFLMFTLRKIKRYIRTKCLNLELAIKSLF
jgi:hypothetical protein